MTTNVSKSQISSVSRQIVAKAQSWGQVAKQLSGMKGKIALSKTEKISVHEAFVLLGVHTKTNKYTAQDLGMAWSARLKEGGAMHSNEEMAATFSGWQCPLLCKAVPMVAEIGGAEFKLYYVEGGEYKQCRVQKLCRVVKAEDKRKGSDDVIVTAQVVLRGLVQSIYVNDTLNGMAESQKEAEAVCEAYVNKGDATEPVWAKVAKDAKGVWSFVEEEKAVEVKVEVAPAKKTTKRGTKKAA